MRGPGPQAGRAARSGAPDVRGAAAVELEIKLTVAAAGPAGPEAFLADLGAREDLGAGYRLGPARRLAIRDVYYDTADGRLRAARVAFRVRRAGSAVLVTVKRPVRQVGGLSQREEYEAPLGPETLQAALERAGTADVAAAVPVADLAAGGRAGPLAPILVAVTERLSRPVTRAGAVVATLAIDRVAYEELPGAPVYCDVEVEAAPAGTEADLHQIAALLSEAARAAGVRLEPGRESKLSRGLRRRNFPS